MSRHLKRELSWLYRFYLYFCNIFLCFFFLIDYFLEDVIQMLGFVPSLNTKKNKNRNEDAEEKEVMTT